MKFSGMLRAFVAISIAAMSAATTVANTDMVEVSVSESSSSDGVLPKSIFSSKLRLVLAVGLEGTGHNYFCQVDDHLFDNNPGLTRLPSNDYLNIARFHIRSGMGDDVKHYRTALASAKAQMRLLEQAEEVLPSPGTVMIIHGKYSYPDNFGANKALMYLDLRLLAEVAEEEGVDFRVVYLRRPVKDILVANTVHREFQK